MSLEHWLRIQLKKNYKKKKIINILTVFFITDKSDVKTFLKLIVNKCP